MSKIRLWFTDEQIDEWFNSMLAYKEEIHRRYLDSPEMWTRTLFNHERVYDKRTNSTKMQTSGTLGTEDVHEMPFNEKNLKELVGLRENDSDIAFTVTDESNGKAVEVKKEANINDTLKLFQKPFTYLLNAEYISP